MATHKEGYAGIKRQKLILTTLMILVVVSQVMTVAAVYIPNALMRRQESGDLDEDLDQNVAASYQDDNNNKGDGYEDNEPDGPYEETPREEEGQADMERFFDDHLGASERDGMDKENLPSNSMPVFHPTAQAMDSSATRANPTTIKPPKTIYSDKARLDQAPSIESRFINLTPDKRLIMTRQITTNGLSPKERFLLLSSSMPESKLNLRDEKTLKPAGSDIVATEDEDMDRVYVTNVTNKPFRIEALGGYDPEEDFKDASRDIEETAKPADSKGRGIRPRGSEQENQEQEQGEEPQVRDINFNDPEADTLFNDASETDEVTFSQDDPYQTDLEAEMRAQSYDKVGTTLQMRQPNKPEPDAPQQYQQGPSEKPQSRSDEREYGDDDSEGSWVNDGVDEMEIPSQSHQNAVLEKAAKQEELARRAAEEQAQQVQQQPQSDQTEANEEPESQRMPNANYLQDDLEELDDIAS